MRDLQMQPLNHLPVVTMVILAFTSFTTTADVYQGSAGLSVSSIRPGANPAPSTIGTYIAPPPPPPGCDAGSCLYAKNVYKCTAAEECTASTESCQVCYTQLVDTHPKMGLVSNRDTHLYRFALCDGQMPFRVYLHTVFGNADLFIWNQPDLAQAPNMTSTDKLEVTATIDIPARLGIRVYTFGVVGKALFGSSYQIWVETQTMPLTRGISFSHSVNEGCSQYYTWLNEFPRGWTDSPQYGGAGHAFRGKVPDQVVTSVEAHGSFTHSDASFNIYSYYNTLKRPELHSLTPNNTRGLVGTALPGRGIGYTVNGQRRLYGYPTKNEFTMPSSSSGWKWGLYFTSVQLLKGTAQQPHVCHMGHTYGGDPLQTGTGITGTLSCGSTPSCWSGDVMLGTSWTCVTGKCAYKGVVNRNWPGPCDSTNCGTAAMKAAVTCEPLKMCRMGTALGGGELTGTKCSSSWDCTSKTYIEDAMFKCDTGASQSNGNQAGGGGKCMFAFDKSNYALIEDFPVNWCVQDSDCYQPWVREGLNCGGPRFNVAVREISELRYEHLLEDVVPYGTIKYYHMPVCNPRSPIDIQVNSPIKAFATLYVSEELQMSHNLIKNTHCAGKDCMCKIFKFNDPSPGNMAWYRVPGTQCETDLQCAQLNEARLKCFKSPTCGSMARCCHYCSESDIGTCTGGNVIPNSGGNMEIGNYKRVMPYLTCVDDSTCNQLKTLPTDKQIPVTQQIQCVRQTPPAPPGNSPPPPQGVCKVGSFFGGGQLAGTRCTSDAECRQISDEHFTCGNDGKCEFDENIRSLTKSVIPGFKNFKCITKQDGGLSNTCRAPFVKGSLWCDGRYTKATKFDFESPRYCMTAPGGEGAVGPQVRLQNTECVSNEQCQDNTWIPTSRFRCNLNLGAAGGLCEYQIDGEKWQNLGHGCTSSANCQSTVRANLVCAGAYGMCTTGPAYGDGTLFKPGGCNGPGCPQAEQCKTDAMCRAQSAASSIPPDYLRCNKKGFRCEMLREAKSDPTAKEDTDSDGKSFIIPFWNGPTRLTAANGAPPFAQGTYKRLGYCADHGECYNEAARTSRRCEKRICHLGTDWGAFPIAGTACNRSSDCSAQLTWDKWFCVKGTPSNAKGRCQIALDGASKVYLTNWVATGFDCFEDTDCQSTTLLDSLFCDGDVTHRADSTSVSTTMYMAVSPKLTYDWATGKYRNTTYADTSLSLDFFDGISRRANGEVDNFNQLLVAPICYYDPPALKATGQQISVWGRNFKRLWKDEGVFHLPIGNPEQDAKLRKQRMQTPRCVFRTQDNFAYCVTSTGAKLHGSVCTLDSHCQVTFSNNLYSYKTGSTIKPFSNVACWKTGTAATGRCYFTPSYCPHKVSAMSCSADSNSWVEFDPPLGCDARGTCLDTLTPEAGATCKQNLKPQCAVPGGGALLGTQCVVASDCRDINNIDPVAQLKCRGDVCNFDVDAGDDSTGLMRIPGTACQTDDTCRDLQPTLVCLPETLRTDAYLWTDELLTCDAPPTDLGVYSYSGETANEGGTYVKTLGSRVQQVLAGFELGELVDEDSSVAYKWELPSPPLLARTYVSKKLIGGASPPPPPLQTIPNGPYQTTSSITYFDTNQMIFNIMPPSGPINGNTQITIRGEHFYETYIGGAWVKVGWLDKVGEYNVTNVDSSHLKLTTQKYNGPAGAATVKISLNYFDFVQPTFKFVYYNEPAVVSIDPSTGDPTGGTLITVSGLNFMYGDVNGTTLARCRFGSSTAKDNVIVTQSLGSKVTPVDGTTSQVTCLTPKAYGPTTVPVEISFNGQQYTSNKVQFKYVSPATENGTCFHDTLGFDTSKPPCITHRDCNYGQDKSFICEGAPFCKVGDYNGGGDLIGSDCLNDHDCEFQKPEYFKCDLPTGICQFSTHGSYKNIENWQTNVVRCASDTDCLKDAHLRRCYYPPMCRIGKNYGGGVLKGTRCTTDADCEPVARGTASLFVCKNFQDNTICRYRNLEIPYLKDYTPEGGVASRLGNPNPCSIGVDDSCQDQIFFNAMRCASRTQVQVLTPNSGPDIGGTNVTITGTNFHTSRNLRCKFGNIEVIGKFLSCVDGTCSIVCTSPRRFTYEPLWVNGGCAQYQLNQVASQVMLEDKTYTAASCSAECASRPWCDKFFVSTGFNIGPGVCLIVSKGCTVSSNDKTFNAFRNTFTELNHCTPLGCTPKSASVYLEVSNNGQEFTSNRVQFTYYSSLVNVTKIIPELGPNEGNTKVAVYGVGFINTGRLQPENIRCRFGTLVVQGKYNTTTGYVQCVSPSAFMVKNWVAVAANEATYPQLRTGFSGIVPLELSFDRGQHYTTSNVSYIYNAAPIKVRQIYPTFGPRTGATKVTMVGDNFNLPLIKQLGYLRLKMGGTYVPVTSMEPATGIQFATPNAETIIPFYTPGTRVYPMEVPVEITLNNQQFTTDGVRFTFFDLPRILNIVPTRGSALGGTVVSIHGTNFLNFGQSACRFGTDKPQMLTKFVRTGAVQVLNHTGMVNSTRTYEFGYYVCTTPPSIRPLDKSPPPVIVDVSLNMEPYQFSETQPFPAPFQLGLSTNVFSYYRVPVVVSSLLPSTGPVQGGTVVTVTGLNFTDSNEMTCRFGYYRSGWNYSPRIVSAKFFSETEIRCISPRGNASYNWAAQVWEDLPKVGTIFDLALNGQQYTSSHTPFNYSYAVDKFYVTKIWPRFAPALSRYRTHLNVTGVNFENTGEMSCKFLVLFSPQQPQFIKETVATFFTPTSVTCWTPYFTAAEWSAVITSTVALDISLNSQNYRSDKDPSFLYKTVTFYNANPPRNVTPSSGPSAGGTDVVIGLDYKSPSEYGAHPTCRWSYPDETVPFDANDATGGVRYFITPAESTKDSTKVTCRTPTRASDIEIIQQQFMPLQVTLEIAFNGQNYEAGIVNFTFYSADSISQISPSSGLTAADYKVTITGNNFLGGNDYRVKFGETPVRSITLESPTNLVVDPPLNQDLSTVHVYVTLNGQNWIDSCLRTFGVTSDHVILHGTCDEFTWAPDPICYTCQTPVKPAAISHACARFYSISLAPLVMFSICIAAIIKLTV